MRKFAACGGLLVGACFDPRPYPVAPADGAVDVDAADVSVDAFPVFSCWPSIPPIERGTVMLGAGGTAFAPLADTLPLV